MEPESNLKQTLAKIQSNFQPSRGDYIKSTPNNRFKWADELFGINTNEAPGENKEQAYKRIKAFVEYNETTGLLRSTRFNSFNAGWFISPTFTELLNLFKSQYQGTRIINQGNLKVSIVSGKDVSKLVEESPSGTFVQLASQFNALEMMHPGLTPQDGINLYIEDPTQGPIAAMTCAPGLFVRNYLKEFNALDKLNLNVQNGYLLWGSDPAPVLEILKDKHGDIKLGATIACEASGYYKGSNSLIHDPKYIHQVFCSAAPQNKYENYGNNEDQSEINYILLSVQYTGIILMSMLVNGLSKLRKSQRPQVNLTLVGGGAFNVRENVIMDAIKTAFNACKDLPVDLYLQIYGSHQAQKWSRELNIPMDGDFSEWTQQDLSEEHTAIQGLELLSNIKEDLIFSHRMIDVGLSPSPTRTMSPLRVPSVGTPTMNPTATPVDRFGNPIIPPSPTRTMSPTRKEPEPEGIYFGRLRNRDAEYDLGDVVPIQHPPYLKITDRGVISELNNEDERILTLILQNPTTDKVSNFLVKTGTKYYLVNPYYKAYAERFGVAPSFSFIQIPNSVISRYDFATGKAYDMEGKLIEKWTTSDTMKAASLPVPNPMTNISTVVVIFNNGEVREPNDVDKKVIDIITNKTDSPDVYPNYTKRNLRLDAQTKSFHTEDGRVGYFIDLMNPPEGISSVKKELVRGSGKLTAYDSKGNVISKWSPSPTSPSPLINAVNDADLIPKELFKKYPISVRFPVVNETRPNLDYTKLDRSKFRVLYVEDGVVKVFELANHQLYVLAKIIDSNEHKQYAPYRFISILNGYKIDMDIVPQYLTFRSAKNNIGYFVTLYALESGRYIVGKSGSVLLDKNGTTVGGWNQLTFEMYNQEPILDSIPTPNKMAEFLPRDGHFNLVDIYSVQSTTTIYGKLPLIVIDVDGSSNVTSVRSLTDREYSILDFILAHINQPGYYSGNMKGEIVDIDVASMAYRDGKGDVHYFIKAKNNPAILQGYVGYKPNGTLILYTPEGMEISKWPPSSK